jgi:hypothetical protein
MCSPKYTLAALIQRFAAAVLRHFFQKAPDSFYSVHQIVEFRELSLGQLQPALGSPSGLAEPEEQLADFVQCKAELSRALDDGKPREYGCVVTPLPAHSQRGREQPNLLVVANCGRTKSNLLCYLGNGELGHGGILEKSICIGHNEVGLRGNR